MNLKFEQLEPFTGLFH